MKFVFSDWRILALAVVLVGLAIVLVSLPNVPSEAKQAGVSLLVFVAAIAQRETAPPTPPILPGDKNGGGP
jgi:predicted MFS family arabinose efflux permease